MRKSFVGWNKADGISCLGCTSRIVCDGITTRYEYDATGRLVREGDRTYTYGYLDKVTSVRDGANTYTYTYHPDGQLATADYGRARTPAAPQGEDSPSFETFTWDGLALIQRGNEHFINEPHVGGGNPVVSSKGTSYFNDMLGTTVGAKSGKTYSVATLSAFGEDLNHHSSTSTSRSNSFFTGKPVVEGLGHAFLMRNYRAGLGKWQTADPLGYPDGWNALAYCNNGVTRAVDYLGCGIVESTIQSAVQEQLNKYTDSNLIQEALNKVSLPSFSPSDDLKVAMSIKVEISDIQVKYRHGIIWETEATMKLDDRDISTDYINTFSRTEPEKYCKRDKKGDRLGPSGVVNNTTNVVLDNIEYSQSKWGYTVTVEEISFCVNITVDFTTVWKHYKPE